MYIIDTPKNIDRQFKKLNPKQLRIISKKLEQISENPYHFKPLRRDLHGARRVHIGSFVLIYEIEEMNKRIIILDYDHHDKIY